jgi:hypothetical protein
MTEEEQPQLDVEGVHVVVQHGISPEDALKAQLSGELSDAHLQNHADPDGIHTHNPEVLKVASPEKPTPWYDYEYNHLDDEARRICKHMGPIKDCPYEADWMCPQCHGTGWARGGDLIADPRQPLFNRDEACDWCNGTGAMGWRHWAR